MGGRHCPHLTHQTLGGHAGLNWNPNRTAIVNPVATLVPVDTLIRLVAAITFLFGVLATADRLLCVPASILIWPCAKGFGLEETPLGRPNPGEKQPQEFQESRLIKQDWTSGDVASNTADTAIADRHC